MYRSLLEEAQRKAEDVKDFATRGHVLAIEAVEIALKNMVDVAVEGTRCEVAMLSAVVIVVFMKAGTNIALVDAIEL